MPCLLTSICRPLIIMCLMVTSQNNGLFAPRNESAEERKGLEATVPPHLVMIQSWIQIPLHSPLHYVRQGRPRWRFHSGQMSGLPPARASKITSKLEGKTMVLCLLGKGETWSAVELRCPLLKELLSRSSCTSTSSS